MDPIAELRDSLAVWPLCIALLSSQLEAQRVLIPRATPAGVVQALTGDLVEQGFKLDHANDSRALFTLDRGLVSQQRGSLVQMVPVVLEFHVRFKKKADGLEVTAFEDVVGAAGSTFEFRRRVESSEERDNMQRLLEKVKADLEAGVRSR